MNFEHIEIAYQLMLENIQLIENNLKTNIYDALIEQNAYFLGADGAPKEVMNNNKRLASLSLSKEEWRRAFQFLFIKANQTERLQANHQFTPDVIGFLILYLLEFLTDKKQLDIIEIGSGTGNLAEILLINSKCDLNYTGLEIDDLLIDLSASIADVINSSAIFLQEDAIRPQVFKECDAVIGDLPVGYYPDDTIASRYQVAADEGHTFAHHLLMEQSLKYLKKDGLAIFLSPTNLLNSPQSNLLKKWLTANVDILAVITLPETLFSNANYAKTLFVLKKRTQKHPETFVYHLSDVQDSDSLHAFMDSLKIWKSENII